MGANSYFDLGGGLGAFQQGYMAKKEMDQKQQQLDYLYPQELSMNPMMLENLSSNPLNQMRNAYLIGQGIAPEAPPREFFDFRSSVPKQVIPQGASNEYAPQDIEAQYLPDETRSPAGSFSIKGTPSMTPKARQILENALRPFQDGTAAAAFGLKQDPDSGRVYGPGRQVKEYYDMLERASQNQAAIMAAGVRPQPQAPASIIMPSRSGGGGRAAPDKEIDRLINQKKASDKILGDMAKKAGIKGTLKSFDPAMLSPDLRDQYKQEMMQNQMIQQRLNRLQGIGPEASYTAPQAAPRKDPAKIMQSPAFKSKVQERMKAKGESAQAAEQFILKKLGY